MADFAFAEVTRLLYEAIWSEFCDWGLELAKVRLADERSSAAEREATWWTLVEALDTYLRLLHPVMPFVTEAIWGALPHRADDPELLIVARWPGAGERDTRCRGARSRRSSSSSARSATPGPRRTSSRATWLPSRRVRAARRSGATFEALRPAIERLARARPLHAHLTPEALHAAGAGDWRAVRRSPATSRRSSAAAAPMTGRRDRERARLEKELAEAETLLAAARGAARERGVHRQGAAGRRRGRRAREAELAEQVAGFARPPAAAARRASPRRGGTIRLCRVQRGTSSALDGAAGDAAHEVALQGEEHDQRQGHRDERRRHQVAASRRRAS